MEVELKEYQKHLAKKEKEWEELCLRCGACCGAYDDPCLHLKKNKNNRFFCDIYRKRFGLRKTIKGEIFNCVPIEKLLCSYWKKSRFCSYKKNKAILT